MSDNEELDKIMKSLNITPNEMEKQKAKEAFLQRAGDLKQSSQWNLKFRFWMNKQVLLPFAAGMAAMLILVAGVTSAVNTSFLTGTVAGKNEFIRYRIFPSKVCVPDVQSSDRYLGELSILHAPVNHETADKAFIPCDGRSLNINDNDKDLFTVLGGKYGYRPGSHEFIVPDYSESPIASGFQYYLAQSGVYPNPGSRSGIIKDNLAYIPEDLSKLTDSGSNYGIYYGEIILLRVTDGNFPKDRFIPCQGQILQVSDYPVLAEILGAEGTSFSLPDLRSKSPVSGAEYYISTAGNYPYEISQN